MATDLETTLCRRSRDDQPCASVAVRKRLAGLTVGSRAKFVRKLASREMFALVSGVRYVVYKAAFQFVQITERPDMSIEKIIRDRIGFRSYRRVRARP